MADPVFLLLSEDGSTRRVEVWSALLKRSFLELVPGTQTQRLRFLPEEGPQFRHMLSANRWKGSRNDCVDLANMIARHLNQGERHFVLLHVDGDQPWPNRRKSENIEKLCTMLLPMVDKVVSAQARSRLLLAVPHYSIEAWLYQNIDHIESIAPSHPQRETLLALAAAWRADRPRLDALERPKDLCPLGDSANHNLATRSWPARETYAAGSSYAASLDAWRECADLLVALQATAA